MEFIGSYRHSVEPRGRLFIPSPFRKILKEKGETQLVITKGTEKCLYIYPMDKWKEILNKLKKLSLYKRGNRDYRRYVLSNAHYVEVDRQGRIQVPQELIKYANLDKEIVIIGNIDFMEVWNPNDFEEYGQSVELTIEDILEEIEDE